MTYDYHLVAGVVAILLGLAGAVVYLRSVFQGKTKSHPFTWLTYMLIDSIAFVAQLTNGGGLGAWVTGVGVLLLITIVIASVRSGERRIATSDWVCFIVALASIVAWRLTGDPLVAVIIITAINSIAAIPTFRKSYVRPFEESVSVWSFDVFKFSLGIVALNSINLITALFPAGIVVTNVALVIMILLRRRRLGKVSGTV